MNRNSSQSLQARKNPARRRAARPSTLSIQRQPHIETKSFSLGALNAAVYAGAAGQYMVDLSAVTQGVSGAQRTGDSLYPTSLLLRFNLWNNTGVTSNLVCNWRIFIFQYKADSSVAAKPIVSDFLQTNPANAGTTYGSFSNYDIDYDRMYTIHWDSGLIQTVGNHGQVITGAPSLGEWRIVEKMVPLGRNRSVDYFTGTTTGFNHIFLCVTTDQATIASNPLLTYSSQFRFTDS
jgi:hypothetical protein